MVVDTTAGVELLELLLSLLVLLLLLFDEALVLFDDCELFVLFVLELDDLFPVLLLEFVELLVLLLD
jgi:hypothetical protein